MFQDKAANKTVKTTKAASMKELPEAERPREKLLSKGVQALSAIELLAILLRTGARNRPVHRVAEELIAKYQLSGLGSVSAGELSNFEGVGLVKAITVVAGIELGKRLSVKNPGGRTFITTSNAAASLLMPFLRYETKERFLALMLSAKNHVLSQVDIAVGGLMCTQIQSREVFKEALNHNAAALILAHNHPSGDPQPSPGDIDLTVKLSAAGNIMGIPVLDHIIIGDGKYVSLKEKGIIK